MNGATTENREEEKAVDQVRKNCLSRGLSTLKCFSTAFRQFDRDYSRQISFREFQTGFKKYGVSLTADQERDLFKRFDKDGSGLIDFNEFCEKMIPPLEGRRLQVVEDVFSELDNSGDGILQASDLMELLSQRAQLHPKCQRGEWTEEEYVKQLLSGFEQPDSRDGVVTLQEFVSYYTAISWCVAEDASFEQQLRYSWGI